VYKQGIAAKHSCKYQQIASLSPASIAYVNDIDAGKPPHRVSIGMKLFVRLMMREYSEYYSPERGFRLYQATTVGSKGTRRTFHCVRTSSSLLCAIDTSANHNLQARKQANCSSLANITFTHPTQLQEYQTRQFLRDSPRSSTHHTLAQPPPVLTSRSLNAFDHSIKMKTDNYLNLCLEQAAKSPLRYRHGAIIVRGGKVIGQGYNDIRDGFDGGALKTGRLSVRSLDGPAIAQLKKKHKLKRATVDQEEEAT
jgi:hypothetical protein